MGRHRPSQQCHAKNSHIAELGKCFARDGVLRQKAEQQPDGSGPVSANDTKPAECSVALAQAADVNSSCMWRFPAILAVKARTTIFSKQDFE